MNENDYLLEIKRRSGKRDVDIFYLSGMSDNVIFFTPFDNTMRNDIPYKGYRGHLGTYKC